MCLEHHSFPPRPGAGPIVPFALSRDWQVLALGFCARLPLHLLPHRLWVPCIKSPHQDQECLLGLLPRQGWALRPLTVGVTWGLWGSGLGVIARTSFLPSLESWFLLEPSEDWRLVSECAVIFQDKGTLAAKLGSHRGFSRLGRRAGPPCPGILLGCEIQPLWHGLVGHGVLPAAASSLPKCSLAPAAQCS